MNDSCSCDYKILTRTVESSHSRSEWDIDFFSPKNRLIKGNYLSALYKYIIFGLLESSLHELCEK